MKPFNKKSISPGKLITLWRIIVVVHKNEGTSIKDVFNLCANLGILGGTIPVKESIKLGHDFGLIDLRNGKVFLTEDCKETFIPICFEFEPNIEISRLFLLRILLKHRFHWLVFFNYDVEIFKTAIPTDWIELLESADLFNFDDAEVLEWWEKVLQDVQKYSDLEVKAIGEVGEKLTIDFEKLRLQEDNISFPDMHVKWVSRISDDFGFDVLSISGEKFKNPLKPHENIQIEVKSSIFSDIYKFRFVFSRNEWEKAKVFNRTYFIYCWVSVSLDKKGTEKGPYIIPINRILDLFPIEKNSICQWSECRLVIDLSKYSINLLSE